MKILKMQRHYLNLYFFLKQQNKKSSYETVPIFKAQLQRQNKIQNLIFFQHFDKFFFEIDGVVKEIKTLKLENWNYFKIQQKNNDLYLIYQQQASVYNSLLLQENAKFVNNSIQLQILPQYLHFLKNQTDEQILDKIEDFTQINCPSMDFYYEHYKQFIDSNSQQQYQFLYQEFNKVSSSFSTTDRKISITHDMQNGYKQDSNPTQNTSQLQSPYRINYFLGTDIFIYFSHHFITIPPVSYIKIGHQTGNKVLGTLIIEDHLLYNDILLDLADPNFSFMKTLLHKMQEKNFDGYLLNFEATNTQKIKLIIQWVQKFYIEIKKLSQDYLLIWYDSINIYGMVNWQGEVNQTNSVFGESSDYFFLDYRWNENKLEKSKNFLPQYKIMPGIDVWSRGTVEGGYNMWKSLQKTLNYSTAIFAPGFSYENFDGEKSRQYLERNEKQLWQGFYIDNIEEVSKFDDTFNYEIIVPFKKLIEELENFDLHFELNFLSQQNEEFGFKAIIILLDQQGQHIASVNSDNSKINMEFIQPIKYQQNNFYNLVLYQSDIYNIKDQLHSFQINVQLKCEQICQHTKLSKMQIYSYKRKQHSAIEFMQKKEIVKLPINTFFNIGHGDNVFFNGNKTEYKNYDYILDYDINLVPGLNPNPVQLQSGTLIDNYFVQIDNNDAYMGTSCLRIGSLLKPFQYLSHLLYTINVPIDQFFIRIIYKLNEITKNSSNTKFLILDENNNRVDKKVQQTIQKLQNGWSMLVMQIDNQQKQKLKLVLKSQYVSVNQKNESVLDIKIGQISILDNMQILDSMIDSDYLDLTYDARYNVADSSIFDLYVQLFFRDESLKIQNCMLFRDDVFLFNIYFTQFKVKNLKFIPQVKNTETFHLICVTDEGIFLPVKQKIIIEEKNITRFELDNQFVQYINLYIFYSLMEEEKKHSEILNEEINTYYKAKYSNLGTDLNQLIQQMNKDFYDEEYLLTDMLLRVEKKKDDMHQLLDSVEEEYDKMQEINDQIFGEISGAKWKIEQYKQKEENIITYLNNLEKLDKTIDSFSLKKLQLNFILNCLLILQFISLLFQQQINQQQNK